MLWLGGKSYVTNSEIFFNFSQDFLMTEAACGVSFALLLVPN
jgi:hypothetical protein